ncbi:MAG: tRNA 2-thiocytidine(32) synthetase TtcA, partial [Candidatus Omnitrophica bacterium]|nr:tRNA 2-thiocytidine(32) synthetase TtcA [Candidatus Omnitrophota bacterium]
SYAKTLEKYFKKMGIEYRIKRSDALKQKKRKDITCFWCSWNRRKELFQLADKLKCTKVALGHHKDDIVETMLLNLFFQGEISAMAPRQELFRGKITLIRPLAYVEEYMIKRFAKEERIPHSTCLCPNSEISNRARMGRIISEIKKVCPDVKTNIFRSLKRIKQDYLL